MAGLHYDVRRKSSSPHVGGEVHVLVRREFFWRATLKVVNPGPPCSVHDPELMYCVVGGHFI